MKINLRTVAIIAIIGSARITVSNLQNKTTKKLSNY